MINIKEEKDKLAIVAVGYNRLGSMRRLLSSLNSACYKEDDVPLVISIDASGDEELYEYVRSFNWLHGEKYVNIQEERLGLKKHILQCGDLTRFFKGVILLEDDLYVARDFYSYASSAIDYYDKEERVAGVSLYLNAMNGYVGIPFHPEVKEGDCFAWQTVSSWGEVWSRRMWEGFRCWLNNWKEDFSSLQMVDDIKKWTRAWSKYFYAYIISNDLYFIYPYISYTTNFADGGGEHGDGGDASVQVVFPSVHEVFRYAPFDNLVKYDVYGQNTSLYETLHLSKEDLSLDLNGLRTRDGVVKKYCLSTLELPFKVIKSFDLQLRPIELNVKNNVLGRGIYLYEQNSKPVSKIRFSNSFISYYLQGFNRRLILQYGALQLIEAIKEKLHIRHS